MLQEVAGSWGLKGMVFLWKAVSMGMLQCVEVCCRKSGVEGDLVPVEGGVSGYVAVCCSVLQCVAVCCSVLQSNKRT